MFHHVQNVHVGLHCQLPNIQTIAQMHKESSLLGGNHSIAKITFLWVTAYFNGGLHNS